MREADRLVNEGDEALKRHDHAAAEAAYRAVLDVDPNHAEALHSLGYIEISRENFLAAKTLLEKAVEQDSGHVGARQLLANALLGMKDFGAAKRCFLAIKGDEPEPTILAQLGLCCEGEADWAEAEKWLRRALESDPSYVTRYKLVGMFRYSPFAADLHHALARILQRQGNHKEARLHYHLAKRNDSTTELDPMYREIMSEADLEDHPYFDAPSRPPAAPDAKNRPVNILDLVRIEDWDTLVDAASGMGKEDLDHLVGLIRAAQVGGMLYRSAQLRMIGDAIAAPQKARATFDRFRSADWRGFFEAAELAIAGKIAPDETRIRLSRIRLDAHSAPLLGDLLERFVKLDLETGVPLAGWFCTLAEDRTDPVVRAEGARLVAIASQSAGRPRAAYEAIEMVNADALPTDTAIRILARSWSIFKELGDLDAAEATLGKLVSRAEAPRLATFQTYALAWRAHLRLSRGRTAEARADCERALALGANARSGRTEQVLSDVMQTIGKKGGPFLVETPALGSDSDEPKPSLRIAYEAIRADINSGRIDRALEGLEALIAEGFARGERAAAAFGLVERARLLARESRFNEAWEAVRRGLASGTPEGRSFDRLSAMLLASHIGKHLGRQDEAVEHAEAAVKAARDLNDRDALRDTLRNLSALLRDSDPQRAVAIFGESLKHGRVTGPNDPWRKAEEAIQNGQLSEALSIYQGLARSETEDDRKHRGHALGNAALVRMRIGDVKGACATMDSAIDAFIDTGNPFKAADAMMRTIHLRRRAGIPHDDMLDRLIAFAEAQKSPPRRRSIGTTAGRAAFDCGRLDAAVPLLSTALEIALSNDWRDERNALTASDLLGRISRITGRYGEALGHYDRALPLAERLGDCNAIATIRGNRAVALRYLDRIDEAVADYEEAIQILERSQDRMGVANNQLNMAYALYIVGRVEPATEAALSAYRHFVAMKVADDADRALACIAMSAPPALVPEHLHAELDALVERGRRSEQPLIRNWADAEAARRMNVAGQTREARTLLRKVAERQRAMGDHYNAARTLLGLAPMLARDGKLSDAMEVADTAADLAERLDQEALRRDALEVQCRIRFMGGAFQQARVLADQLEALSREARDRLKREADRVFLADRMARVMDDFAAAHVNRGDLGAALETLDRGRAPALLDRLGKPARDPLEVAEMERLIRRVGHDTTLIALAWIGETLSAFTLRPGEAAPQLHNIGLGRADVERMLSDFQRDVVRYRGEGPMIWTSTAARIFNAVIDRLPEDGTVILLTEEELAPLPLELAPLADGDALIDRAAVVYAPNLRFLAHASAYGDARATGAHFMAVGVAFQDEALAILQRGLVPGVARGLTGNRLDPTCALEAASKARIAHFACHGLFDPENYLDSGLVLTIDEDVMAKDVLMVRDIAETRVAAELVVLSACATGRGEASASDFLGLGRAWLSAGARGTITALWNIENAATQALMLDFYRLLSEERGGVVHAARALRAAQRAAAERGGLYQWGAFRYTGWPLITLPEEPFR